MPAREVSNVWHDPQGLPTGPAAVAAWTTACDHLVISSGDLAGHGTELYELRAVSFESTSNASGSMQAEAACVGVLPDPPYEHLIADVRPADDVAALGLVFADRSATVVTRAGAVYYSSGTPNPATAVTTHLCVEMAAHLLGAPRRPPTMSTPDWLGRLVLSGAVPVIAALHSHADAQPWLVEHAAALADDAAPAEQYLLALDASAVASRIAQVALVLGGDDLSAGDTDDLTLIATMSHSAEPDMSLLQRAGALAASRTLEQAWALDVDLVLWQEAVRTAPDLWNPHLAYRCAAIELPTREQALAALARVAGTAAARLALGALQAAGWAPTDADETKEVAR